MRIRKGRMTMRIPNHWIVLIVVICAYMIMGYYDSMDATLDY